MNEIYNINMTPEEASNKIPVILEKKARSGNIDGYIYSLLSNDKKSIIRIYTDLSLIINWAKNNGYVITNIKEFI
jgi:hypothetical protein